LLPPHWFSWLLNRRRLIVTAIGTGTMAASPIILGISSGGVTGVTAGPASRWEGSSAKDARLEGSTGTATPCRDTAGTDRDGIHLQVSISGSRHADRRSRRGGISSDQCAIRMMMLLVKSTTETRVLGNWPRIRSETGLFIRRGHLKRRSGVRQQHRTMGRTSSFRWETSVHSIWCSNHSLALGTSSSATKISSPG
jgi:hypothetical protein